MVVRIAMLLSSRDLCTKACCAPLALRLKLPSDRVEVLFHHLLQGAVQLQTLLKIKRCLGQLTLKHSRQSPVQISRRAARIYVDCCVVISNGSFDISLASSRYAAIAVSVGVSWIEPDTAVIIRYRPIQITLFVSRVAAIVERDRLVRIDIDCPGVIRQSTIGISR